MATSATRAARDPDPSGFPWLADVFHADAAQGRAAMERFTVTPEEARFSRLRAMIAGGGRRGAIEAVDPGAYVRLMIDGEVMMSDTALERRTCAVAVRRAHGDTLVAGLGLGLGLILAPICAKPTVRSVTVVELLPEVIDLVAPRWEHPKLRIVHGDIRIWRPPRGVRYGYVWHDIWPTICRSNLDDMALLRRRAARWLDRDDPDAGQDCWAADLCRDMR